jgi:hypothetical protein
MLNNDLVRIGLVILAGILLLQLLNRNSSARAPPQAEEVKGAESMENQEAEESQGSEEQDEVVANDTEEDLSAPVQSAAEVPERPKDCFPKDTLSADDLLPKDKHSQWAEVNPEGSGELKDRNFVEAGWHFGIDTVGQSLRNANYQVRSEPANPQVKVSPWMQSTIGPDANRKALEIGGC